MLPIPFIKGSPSPPPTYDVEHAEWASPVLLQPGVYTGSMELVEAGNDSELLKRARVTAATRQARNQATPTLWPPYFAFSYFPKSFIEKKGLTSGMIR